MSFYLRRITATYLVLPTTLVCMLFRLFQIILDSQQKHNLSGPLTGDFIAQEIINRENTLMWFELHEHHCIRPYHKQFLYSSHGTLT